MNQPFSGGQHNEEVVEVHDAVDRVRQFVYLGAEVGGKQCIGHNVQGEMHHVDGNVALLASAPGLAHARRLANHGRRIFRDPLAMERRLRHLPLQPVLSALGGDHAFAKKHLRAPHRAFLDEIVVLHHQYFADVIRMIQEQDVVPANLVVGDVAVRLR